MFKKIYKFVIIDNDIKVNMFKKKIQMCNKR